MSRCQNRFVPTPDSIRTGWRGVQGVYFGQIGLRIPLPRESHIVFLIKLLTKYLFNFFGTNDFLSRLDESFRLSLFNGMVYTLGPEMSFTHYETLV